MKKKILIALVILGGLAALGANTTQLLSFVAPLINSGGSVSCRTATGSVSGCLASSDFNNFNGKQAALTSLPSSCTGGQYATILSTTGALSCAQVQYSQINNTPTLYYQTLQSNTTAQTQRANLNFSSNFALTDSAGSNRSTVDLASPITANTSGNAATATALTATPSQCSSGNYSTGVTANGTANCAQVQYSQIGSAPALIAASLDTTQLYENVGTVTLNGLTWWEINHTLCAQWHATTGTVVAATFAIDLPSSKTIDTSKYTSDVNSQSVGEMWRYISGGAIPGTTNGPWALFYDGSTNNKIFMALFYGSGTNEFAKGTVTQFVGSGQMLAGEFCVQVTN